MKINFQTYIKQAVAVAAGVLLLASCNKENLDAVPIEPASSSQQSINEIVNANASFSILKAAIARATPSGGNQSLSALLSDTKGLYTVFAPTDQAFQAAFQALGIPASVGINALSPGMIDTILRYHIVGGQRITADSIANRTPNVQLPTLLSLAPPSASLPPGLRMSIFPSKNVNLFWVNNVPMQGQAVNASNGIIYPLGFVALPPSTFLWNRINTDPNLTYFRAAIIRADSGSTAGSSLVAALSNPAANLTAFIPTDAAVKQLLTAQITAALVAQGIPQVQAQGAAALLASTPDVFNNPLLFSALPAQLVKGLVVYHLLGTRVFSVNMPTTPTFFKTILNTAVPAHPGVQIKATFGTTGVTAATVKGLMNQSASNVLINPTPGAGTSDQHYINGVLHEIDQVLLPQ
jgi:uncharacterized surface protein with fasciclin (FAS1) repeats